MNSNKESEKFNQKPLPSAKTSAWNTENLGEKQNGAEVLQGSEVLNQKIQPQLLPWAEKAMDDLNNFLASLEVQNETELSQNKTLSRADKVKKMVGDGLKIMKNKVSGGRGNIRSFLAFNKLLLKIRNTKNSITFADLAQSMTKLLEDAGLEVDDLSLKQKIENYKNLNNKNILVFAHRVSFSTQGGDAGKVGAGIKAEIYARNKKTMRENLLRSGTILGVSATLGFPFSMPLLAMRFASSLKNNYQKDLDFNLNKLMQEAVSATQSGFEQVFSSSSFQAIFETLKEDKDVFISGQDFIKLKNILHKANALDGLSPEYQEQIVDYLVLLRQVEGSQRITEEPTELSNLISQADDLLQVLEKNIIKLQSDVDSKVAEMMAKGGGQLIKGNGETLEVKAEYKEAFGKKLVSQKSFRFIQAGLMTLGLGTAAWKFSSVVGEELLKADQNYLGGSVKSFLVENNPFSTVAARSMTFKTPEGVQGVVTAGHLPDSQVQKLLSKGYELDPKSTESVKYFTKIGTGHLEASLTPEDINDPMSFLLEKDLVDIKQLPENTVFDSEQGYLAIKVPKEQNYVELEGRVFTPYDSGPVGKINGQVMYLAGKDPVTNEIYLTTADGKAPVNIEFWNPQAEFELAQGEVVVDQAKVVRKNVIGAFDTLEGERGLAGASLLEQAKTLNPNVTQEELAAKFFVLQSQGGAAKASFGSGGEYVLTEEKARQVVNTLFEKSGYTDKNAFIRNLLSGRLRRDNQMALAVYESYLKNGVPGAFAKMNSQAMADNPVSFSDMVSRLEQGTKIPAVPKPEGPGGLPQGLVGAALAAGGTVVSYGIDRAQPAYIRRGLVAGQGLGNHPMDFETARSKKVTFAIINGLTRIGIPIVAATAVSPILSIALGLGSAASIFGAHKGDIFGNSEQDVESVKAGINTILEEVNLIDNTLKNPFASSQNVRSAISVVHNLFTSVENLKTAVQEVLSIEQSNHVAGAYKDYVDVNFLDPVLRKFIIFIGNGSRLERLDMIDIQTFLDELHSQHSGSFTDQFITRIEARLNARRVELNFVEDLQLDNLPDETKLNDKIGQNLNMLGNSLHLIQDLEDNQKVYLENCYQDYFNEQPPTNPNEPPMLGRYQILKNLYAMAPEVTNVQEASTQRELIRSIFKNLNGYGWDTLEHKKNHSSVDHILRFKNLVTQQAGEKAKSLILNTLLRQYDNPDVVLNYDLLMELSFTLVEILPPLEPSKYQVVVGLLAKSNLQSLLQNYLLENLYTETDNSSPTGIENFEAQLEILGLALKDVNSSAWSNLGISPDIKSFYQQFYNGYSLVKTAFDNHMQYKINPDLSPQERLECVNNSMYFMQKAMKILPENQSFKTKYIELYRDVKPFLESLFADYLGELVKPGVDYRPEVFKQREKLAKLQSLTNLIPESLASEEVLKLKQTALILGTIGQSMIELESDPLVNEPEPTKVEQALKILDNPEFREALENTENNKLIKKVAGDYLHELEVVAGVRQILDGRYDLEGGLSPDISLAQAMLQPVNFETLNYHNLNRLISELENVKQNIFGASGPGVLLLASSQKYRNFVGDYQREIDKILVKAEVARDIHLGLSGLASAASLKGYMTPEGVIVDDTESLLKTLENPSGMWDASNGQIVNNCQANIRQYNNPETPVYYTNQDQLYVAYAKLILDNFKKLIRFNPPLLKRIIPANSLQVVGYGVRDEFLETMMSKYYNPMFINKPVKLTF